MKRLLGTLFAATLVLSACSQDDTKEDENKKSESTTEKKADDKKDKKTKEDKKSKEEKKSQENEDSKSTQENNSTEEQNTQETATNEQTQSQQQTQQSDNHEPTKEEIYQWDKQNVPGGTDYGLIDEHNANAGDSQTEQRYDYDHNGVYRTPAEQKAHEQWVNDQIEWNKQQEAKEQRLEDEYFDLSDKMFEDGVSESEYNSMEKRQEEILDEVEPIN